ncbi:uncharacterized protein [Gossypium hirsutum]|uniref:Uncharacterized protein LOC107917994 isoform X1 n=1 Tax=Gossypium hirsutum TaxID=3635 RepID=A0A1U8KKH0_GOSHI|nr:uncharacterized protein LOC107917994 isoform X1 [Gossypium hirsutum]XP_040931501.1 uncharacterized protein LOC107917994 isoform X1 [Gossypium hirsutum]
MKSLVIRVCLEEWESLIDLDRTLNQCEITPFPPNFNFLEAIVIFWSSISACLNFILCCAIKLEREKVLPKTEQKIHKEREKEKKKKRKEKDKTQGAIKKLKKLEDVLDAYKDDQLERSDLTEEHEPPVCYISDGSQNSHKRKRDTASYSECSVDGNIIKIRFSLKKPRASDASISSEEPACSSSGRTDSIQEPNCTIASVPELKLQHDDGRKEQGSSSSGTLLKAALQYKTFIEDWMPPLLEAELNNDGDEDWLLTKKQLGKPAAKRPDDNDHTCVASASLHPSAHFLPAAEIYALPYTVPF